MPCRWILVLISTSVWACEAEENRPTPIPAGSLGGPCHSSQTCDGTLICNADAICELSPQGSEGDPCYSDGTCDGTLICNADNICELPPQGSEGGPCYGDGTCDGTLICNADAICELPPQGSEGDPCYGDGTCDGTLICNADNICELPPQGSEGGPCYGDGTCDGELVCNSSNICQMSVAVDILGRVWNYGVDGMTVAYDYPWSQVTISALNAGATPLAETLSDVVSCTPWDPPDPYTCGMFTIGLNSGQQVMLKATNNFGHKDTLTRIFEVAQGADQLVVMASEEVLDLMTTLWSSTVESGKGYVAGVVAVSTGDIYGAPFEAWVGGASVEIAPAEQFGTDYELVYYNSTAPTDKTLTATDADAPFFVALNLPPRPFDDPYEMTVTHHSYDFLPVSFAVEADTLTYLVLSPQP